VPDMKAKRIKWYQHFDVDESSRALENRPGGVETNTLNAFQIELIGTCDERHKKTWGSLKAGIDYIFWPDAPDWALKELAKLVRWLYDYHHVPMTCGVTFKAYNKGQVGGSYGTNNGVRLSYTAWNKYNGYLGHQHVPEQNHGDPGNIDIVKVLTFARAMGTVAHEPSHTATNRPKVGLSHLVSALKKDVPARTGHVTYKEEVLIYERALVKEGLLSRKWADGSFGTATVEANSAWQSRYSKLHGLHWSSDDLDGVPGMTSARALGAKYGFEVVA